MSLNKHYRNHLRIKLSVLQSNFKALQEVVSPLGLMAVLKADAYGLGAQIIGKALIDAGAEKLAVADLHEAMELKNEAVELLILGDLIPEEIFLAVQQNFQLPIGSIEKARLVSREAVRQGCQVKIHLVIDTGMGRLGIPMACARREILEIAALENLEMVGIYSHFPVAYTDREFSLQQIDLFKELLSFLNGESLSFEWIHIANSDGIQNLSEACELPFNLARTGLNLYGCFDLQGERRVELNEILDLKSRLVRVRVLKAGSTLGYGRTYELKKDKRIGTVAIGYADGFPMSEEAGVMVNGHFCPVLGRVSMDYITVDLDVVPEAESGDEVICIGEGISIADWARWKGTLTYEIICSLGKRVERVYR